MVLKDCDLLQSGQLLKHEASSRLKMICKKGSNEEEMIISLSGNTWFPTNSDLDAFTFNIFKFLKTT